MIQNPCLKYLILYVAMSAGGWLFACIGLSGIRQTRKRQAAETAVTTATVVDVVRYQHRSRSSRGRRISYHTYWRSVVEYEVDGRHYRLEGMRLNGKPDTGDTIDIWYNPDDPSQFHQKGQLEMFLRSDLCTAAIGAAWGILSVFLAGR